MSPVAPLSESDARAIYGVLVELAGASPLSEDGFVLHYASGNRMAGHEPSSEWRFGGSLGFGGKLRYPALTVDCYPEDETPERLTAIKATNARLAALKASLAAA